MCISFPGKIKKINDQIAVVDFDGIEKEVNITLVDVEKNDYVLVHAGFAIEKVPKDSFDELNKYLKNE